MCIHYSKKKYVSNLKLCKWQFAYRILHMEDKTCN